MSRDTTSREAYQWAIDQQEHLTVTEGVLLVYLVMNSFVTGANHTGGSVGEVVPGRGGFQPIRKYTGLSRSTVRRGLHSLRDKGYIVYYPRQGGTDGAYIAVAWGHEMDALRAEVRRGLRGLPKEFSVPPWAPREKPQATAPGGVVVPFRRISGGSP